MVARPPLRVSIAPMTVRDLDEVQAVERASFAVPWPAYALRQEIETNRLARYLVVRAGEQVVGYAGVWLMADEAHVTTFAVLPEWRRRGLGGRLMVAVMRLAEEVGARVVTLEVRLSNVAAQRLYQRFGLRPVGVRPRYYSDNNEDALIMTSPPIDEPEMRERIALLARRYEASPLEEVLE
ncbi:MAG TPA: ribosomal protein S18-alanine N-acetyltransferase [Candidatus Limnocylindrales bacterium]|nr:ribosomal protein S18-alanine N-acetyltransferase [Candidatus Limnocylindrales bacterium]